LRKRSDDIPPQRFNQLPQFLQRRIVLFGGTAQTYSADGRTLTETPLHDTWEFDGTNWRQITTDGPTVLKPYMEYDRVRKQTIMLGNDEKGVTLMYAYDAAAGKWNQVAPATLPPCAVEGGMTWQGSNNTILFTGGTCATAATTEDTYEWDGTTWNKIDILSFAGRYFGMALTFDPDHQNVVMFGGAPPAGTLVSATYTYVSQLWLAAGDRHLSRRHAGRIVRAAAQGSIYVSPISAWEIALLERKGRIRLHRPIELWLDDALAAPGLNVAPLTPQIAAAGCHLPEPFHADPADRMLVATARNLGASLVTADVRIIDYARKGHVAILR